MEHLTHWATQLASKYQIEGQLRSLAGEFDLNLAVDCGGQFSYVLKVMRPNCEESLIDLQCRALEHIAKNAPEIAVPRVVKTRDGLLFCSLKDEQGHDRLVWLITVLPGKLYGDVRPHKETLLQDVGSTLARLNVCLVNFAHETLERELKWDMIASEWINEHRNLIEGASRQLIVKACMDRFAEILPIYRTLPKIVIHNDANDYNILTAANADGAIRVSGLIDFGDMISAPAVAEIAIAAAYAILGQSNPVQALSALVSGYHRTRPLTEQEIELIYPLVRTRLSVSVTNAAIAKREKPDDPYVTISERPAWVFLELSQSLDENHVTAALKIACGFAVVAGEDIVLRFLENNRKYFSPVVDANVETAEILDLSITSNASPDPFVLDDALLAEVAQRAIATTGCALGRYGEPRLIYTGAEFRSGPDANADRRTIHLGVDVFARAGALVSAPCDGKVVFVGHRPDRLDYGGLVVLQHATPSGERFYTLYGHLAKATAFKIEGGDTVSKGTAFARLGEQHENGGWPPHLHFQLALTLPKDNPSDWPGVCDPDNGQVLKRLYPNPAELLGVSPERVACKPADTQLLLGQRNQLFGKSLKLSYKKPHTFVRGWKHLLFDAEGRCYIDGYNNVPHVGHAHPRIADVATKQLRLINSNTRYLHPAQLKFAKKLQSKLPKSLNTCFFVNSASEANELALRLARAHTGALDTIVVDVGYHGNTNAAIDISAYKFNGPGGRGKPDWVHVVPVADPYRGAYRYGDALAGQKYGDTLKPVIEAIHKQGKKLAAFICEIFPSVGGQVIPPDGYMARAYEHVRQAGGLCIADEVQTGLGRVGTHYWGFEAQGVVPDMVVLGKPIGNGHPIGVVVTTSAIAESFANGMEFFSTFGGSTLSCAIGHEVMQIVDDEKLQDSCLRVGNGLLQDLKKLAERHKIIGDVRGSGLFIGVELIKDQQTAEPATEIASYIVNRMSERRILIGSDGPHDNVLKIRPPLTIDTASASLISRTLDEIMHEERCLT